MTASAPVLVIGEALIDIIEAPGAAPRELVGGSPANVAIGLARLGHPTRLRTRIGRDTHGDAITRHLEGAGVAIDPASHTDTPTSTARAVLQPDGSAQYVFDIAWDITDADTHRAGLVHAGSLALFLEPGAAHVLDALERASARAVTVTLDPNIRPALVGSHADAHARFERAARAAALVKLSDEDAAWLYPGLSDSDVLAAIGALGPQVVVLTRGSDGAIGRARDGRVVEVPAPPVRVADTIGAGDSFMAALVAAVADRGTTRWDAVALADAMSFAARAAAITVSRPGADPPTRAELDQQER